MLGKKGRFAGTHILVPRGGVAVHINAFNFPVWGLLEKFAPTFLAGMPCIAKPATSTSYLTEALVRMMMGSGLLPAGSLQLVIGSTGDLLDRLESSDVVTFTGSADTALKLRGNQNLLARSIPFNAEADSLNAAILGPDVAPGDEEFELFVKEVAREMTMKAGQKCTAIRRAIVPRRHLDALAAKLRDRLAKVSVGDPSVEGVKMGALASKAQQADVAERVALLAQGNEIVFGAGDGFAPLGDGVAGGAFFAPTLAPLPRRHEQRRRPRRRGVRPGLDPDAVRRLRPGAGARRARPRQPGRDAGDARPEGRGARRSRRWRRGTAACSSSTARPPPSRPATARRCRCSSTAARAAPAAARSSAACARSSTSCNAPRSRDRRRC